MYKSVILYHNIKVGMFSLWGLSSSSNYSVALDPVRTFSRGSVDSETRVIISWTIKNARDPRDIL